MGIEQYASEHFGTSTSQAGTNPCSLPRYAERGDIEQIFGKENVKKWADVDNNGVLIDIDTRICWALAESRAFIDARLRGGPYAIPFVAPFNYQIISQSARFAGVLLYESRGITDFSENGRPQHQLSAHRDQVLRWLQQIIAGLQRLDLAQVPNTPAAVPFIDEESDPVRLEDYFYPGE